MRGYYTGSYYYGFIPSIGKYWRFATEREYIDFLKERGEV